MEKSEVLEKVNEVFIDILDNEDIVLTYETTANDVDDWDSLNHIQLVVAIEKKFKIRFTSQEIQSWKNVGEMLDCILTKVA
ncbi:MAG: acyl carrier protein [Chitinophagaceae bacterium]|nr:acyl carrier protein [Chitinophagaceae bacterium]